MNTLRVSQLLACVAGALTVLLSGAAVAQQVSKKGIAMGGSYDKDGSRLDKFHVGWYYNWTMVANSPASSGCFVPMYWGKKGQLPQAKALAGNRLPVLLTFNEPDFTGQSNRTVAEVLQEWPVVQGMAKRVSSPTPGRPFEGWMRDFTKKADSLRMHYDFVPVHWYGGPDVENFMGFLDRLHKLYGKPLWITEFAVADWHSSKYKTRNRFTDDDVVKFIKQVLPRLDALPYVERYAWIAATTDKESLRPSLMYTGDGKLTKVGLAYAEHNYQPSTRYCGQP